MGAAVPGVRHPPVRHPWTARGMVGPPTRWVELRRGTSRPPATRRQGRALVGASARLRRRRARARSAPGRASGSATAYRDRAWPRSVAHSRALSDGIEDVRYATAEDVAGGYRAVARIYMTR